MSFVMTKELAYQLENAEIETLSSRLTAIQNIQGNPMGVELNCLQLQLSMLQSEKQQKRAPS